MAATHIISIVFSISMVFYASIAPLAMLPHSTPVLHIPLSTMRSTT
jgi:hypothetical protein